MNQVFFFHIHKIVSRVSKEAFKKSFVEGIKIFLKKKKNKKRRYACERYQNLSEEEKEKKASLSS